MGLLYKFSDSISDYINICAPSRLRRPLPTRVLRRRNRPAKHKAMKYEEERITWLSNLSTDGVTIANASLSPRSAVREKAASIARRKRRIFLRLFKGETDGD